MEKSNSKEIVKLYNYYRNIQKTVGKVKLRTKDFYETVSRNYNLEEVKIFRALDGNYYIRLLCCYNDGYEDKKSFRYFNDKNQQVSYAEFDTNGSKTYIEYLSTNNQFRHKGLARNAVLKIKDYSVKYNKGRPLQLLCVKRNREDEINKNYLMYKKMGFYNVYNAPVNSDAIIMEYPLINNTNNRSK